MAHCNRCGNDTELYAQRPPSWTSPALSRFFVEGDPEGPIKVCSDCLGRGGPYRYCLRCGTNAGTHLRGGLCDWCAVVESVPYMEPEEGQKPPLPPSWWPWN